MNADNIVSKVHRISLQESTSKNGHPYVMMVLHFINGYKFRMLINDDQKFGVKDGVTTQSQTSDMSLEVD